MLSIGYDFSHVHAATLPYASPEVLSQEKYNQKTDVWALGCILYEMVAGKRAYNFSNEEIIKQRILHYPVPLLPVKSSQYKSIDYLNAIYNFCMKKNQDERPTIKEILNIDII